MNLQQLKYIIALDQTGSFSKAAETCFVTQATLSTMIKRLEEELGVVLFDRKSNPIITTDCGKDIVAIAKKAVFHTHQLREAARDVQRRIEGKLRIGIIPTIANNLLPIIVKPLVEKYPLLKMEIAEMTTDHILAGLKDGMIDVGILSTPLPQAADYEEEVLYYEQLLVYGDTAAQKQFIMPDEIIQEKIWLLEEGHCLREQFINLCSLNRKETAGNFHFEANSFETLLNMVDSFGGLTLLPELYVRSMPLERRAHVLSFAPPYPVREVSLLYFRPFAKHRLINMLSNELKTLVPPLLSAAALKASEQVIAQI